MTARDLSSAITDNLEDDVVYPFFAIDLQFDSAPIRLWTGVGTLVYEGISYIGAGNLLDISSIEETSEMAVKGATIILSGMSSEVISLALQSPYQGRVCKVYFGMFSRGSLLKEDGNYILLEDGRTIALETQEKGLTQIFSGYMDEMNITEGPEFGTIELKVENKLIDLERQRVRRFTNQFQKSLYPNDRGLEFVEDIQDKEIVWGRSVN
jgi:hypothetical protein